MLIDIGQAPAAAELASLALSTRAPVLETVIYRSRARAPFPTADLLNLVKAAQIRNRTLSVTGMVIYDQQYFLQWLEGPARTVRTLVDAIRQDPRHGDFELLADRYGNRRVFGSWDMMLGLPWPNRAARREGAITPPPNLIETLHGPVEDAPDAMAAFGAFASETGARGFAASQQSIAEDALSARPGARQSDSSLIGDFVRRRILPLLHMRLAKTPAPHVFFSPATRRMNVERFAELIIAEDEAPAHRYLDDLFRIDPQTETIAALFEPTSRRLGDWWLDDKVSAVDIAVGLSRMQTSLRRRLHGVSATFRGLKDDQPSILVAPQPGEPHILGAVLDSEILWKHGWSAEVAFPSSLGGLRNILADNWFDILDLSLSPVFQQAYSLPQISETVAAARAASQNPNLAIIVGGRMFAGDPGAAAQIKADATIGSALEIEEAVMRTLSFDDRD